MSENHKLDTDTQVFFYEQDFYVLSNFSAFRLEWNGQVFDTSEAAYQSEKFMGWANGTTSAQANWDLINTIREAPSAHEAFKIAERNKVLRRPDWDDVKVGIMRKILRAKALQHEYVRRKLLATGHRELIEDSWRDDFWGWGPNRNGKNMLGKLWMNIRAELRGASMPDVVTPENLEMIEKAAKAVSHPVPWTSNHPTFPDEYGLSIRAVTGESIVEECDDEETAAHLANCDPQTILALLRFAKRSVEARDEAIRLAADLERDKWHISAITMDGAAQLLRRLVGNPNEW